MASLVSQLENSLNELQSIQPKDSANFDRCVDLVLDLYILNESYHTIWDEQLLARANLLLSQALGDNAERRLANLRSHLSQVRVIHNKLYAVLDHENDLESLLLDHLANWPEISGSLQCNFTELQKNSLHQSRVSGEGEQRLRNFFNTYINFLKEHGFNNESTQIEAILQQALEGYRRLREWQVYALFALGEQGDVYGLKVNVVPNGQGLIRAVNPVGTDMETSAGRVVAFIWSHNPHVRNWDFFWEINRSDTRYDGESIGLGLTLATLMRARTNFDIDPYTAFTGKVDTDGNVHRIEHLGAKLQAAQSLGIRRVFIPLNNREEANGIDGLKIVPVTSVNEALRILQGGTYLRANTNLKTLAENKIQRLEISLKANNISKIAQNNVPNSGIRVEFTDRTTKITVIIYHAKEIKCVVQGNESPLKQLVQTTCDDVFGQKAETPAHPTSTKPETRKYLLTDAMLQEKLRGHLLRRGDAIQESENNCVYRIKITMGGQTVHVRQYTSGTLTVAGLVPLLDVIDKDVQVIIGASSNISLSITPDSRLEAQKEAVRSLELGEQWIGTDEAGKGDYYGPLVTAAVLVTQELAEQLKEAGVKDSKALSDKRNIELAEIIRRLCGKRAQVVIIPPERYNSLYEQFQREKKNLNDLLAWGHTRALEDILAEYPLEQVTVIIDKFADESFVEGKLLSKSRQTNLNLIQIPKAEANIAVAAASVLARAQFLQSLARMSNQYKIDFPKGASDPRIIQVGKEVITRFGEDELRKVAKVHFSTTQKLTR